MKESSQEKMCIVFLTTYPPRECGIATFSADLIDYFDDMFMPKEETKVVTMNTEILSNYKYDSKVIFEISENNGDEYREVAEKLNEMDHVKLISIQHEFGIFGRNYGENLLVFLAHIKKPVVVTFHTVLPHPDSVMKNIVWNIIENVGSVVVMTETSKKLLEDVYRADSSKIKIIPHGIHPHQYKESSAAKEALDLSGKKVISTFGLLNRGKGIEYGIKALPEVIKIHPDLVYLIIGATHPVVLKREGEVYRNELIELTKELGVEKNVIFYNDYLDTPELLKFLEATDIYLALSQNPDQAVSGTLSYALGAGRPVISTPFMQAKELITPDVGSLVEFNDSESIKNELITLFNDRERMMSMGRTAYFRTRGMIWPNVALSYMREFIALSPDLAQKEKTLPPLKLDQLRHLTDDFGIFQFAILNEPNPLFGYTLDDNARALIVLCLHQKIINKDDEEKTAEIYLSFLEFAAKPEGGFENYITSDKQFEKSATVYNLEDANGRAMWALATLSVSGFSDSLKKRAQNLFEKQMKRTKRFVSPRAIAFYIKALSLWLQRSGIRGDDEYIKNTIADYADILLDLYVRSSNDEWKWFEEALTYSNGVIPESMIIAYTITQNKKYFDAGKITLDFLIKQSFDETLCVPVGQSGWFKQGGIKYLYDQQPEEVSALILALKTMADASNDEVYIKKMEEAFGWFLGNNILHQVVYSHMTGGCYDGVGENHINLNQGAESTISYLLARLVMEEK